MIHAGKTLREIAQNVETQSAIVQNYNGLIKLRSLLRPVRTEAPKVIWLHGPTGTGKTHLAYEFALVYTGGQRDSIWSNPGLGIQWMDGYDGHPVAILDDFRPNKSFPFAYLLRVLDKYDFQVPIKGGFVTWNPNVIIITCPKSPEAMYEHWAKWHPEDVAQLLRRIDLVLEIPGPDFPEVNPLVLWWGPQLPSPTPPEPAPLPTPPTQPLDIPVAPSSSSSDDEFAGLSPHEIFARLDIPLIQRQDATVGDMDVSNSSNSSSESSVWSSDEPSGESLHSEERSDDSSGSNSMDDFIEISSD